MWEIEFSPFLPLCPIWLRPTWVRLARRPPRTRPCYLRRRRCRDATSAAAATSSLYLTTTTTASVYVFSRRHRFSNCFSTTIRTPFSSLSLFLSFPLSFLSLSGCSCLFPPSVMLLSLVNSHYNNYTYINNIHYIILYWKTLRLGIYFSSKIFLICFAKL